MRDDTMDFSVLMAVYGGNTPAEVSNAIRSVTRQSLQPEQIVIVIDGPVSQQLTDAINDCKNENTLIVPLPENVGLGRALNIGIQHCRYEYVARMDADDYSRPERFEQQMTYLQAHPDVDVLGGLIAEYDEQLENFLTVRRVPSSDESIRAYMKKRNAMNHMTVVFKKSKLLGAGGYQHCPYFEDYYLWCRMLQNGCRFHNLQRIVVDVRSGYNMISRRGGSGYVGNIRDFEKQLLEMGYISRFEYMRNTLIRTTAARLPGQIRTVFYRRILRT